MEPQTGEMGEKPCQIHGEVGYLKMLFFFPGEHILTDFVDVLDVSFTEDI